MKIFRIGVRANAVEAVQDGRIYIELVNAAFLYQHNASPAEYKAGLDLAIARGWLWLHEIRDLCEVHTSRRGVVCVIADGWKRLGFADPIRCRVVAGRAGRRRFLVAQKTNQ
jgi:hypothetical protein